MREACPMLTMHFGPHEVLLTLELKFRDELSAVGVRGAVARLQQSVRKEHPDITRIFFASESVAQDDSEGAADAAKHRYHRLIDTPRRS